ncbi:coiled-coil domain-containing protein 92 [Trichomycterus rosablanca]|uniref:coiled-coil domain-containing protein 92 n=1 Tax=Trichomycterus rosablanca TaxID=2290929 RepID=UPI002F3502CF
MDLENVTMENQLHSAQKNLMFLQQDHANTLKGLHAEISRLQQHCTELNYELTVRSSDPNDDGEARCLELQRRCEELEEQLKVKEQENSELLRELEQKNAMISVLENTIREREKKYLDELKLKSHRLAVLSGELEQRAGTIAFLTAQLHATKKRLLEGGAAFRPSPPTEPRQASPRQASPTASPGKQPDTPRRRMRKSLSQPLHCEYTELYKTGAADGRRLVLRDATGGMPDPGPFLQPRETLSAHGSSEVQMMVRERPPVIPPIAPSVTSPAQSPRQQRGSAHVGVAHRIHHPPAEVETLAVDQVGKEKVVRESSGTDRTV